VDRQPPGSLTVDPSAPVAIGDRVAVMDVLRGIALLGVFLANMTGFAHTGVMATEGQLAALPTAPWDAALHDVLDWLVTDKANTTFAFLFGLGFWLQMQRLEARGAHFERIYRRRLLVLLAIGVLNLYLLWTWDILHLYALAGFALLALRRVSNRTLVVLGVLCAWFGRTAQKTLSEFAGAATWTGAPDPYGDAAVLARQELSARGDYPGLVASFYDFTWVDYLSSGLLIGWLLYALGRFLIGAWVGRHQWIARARDFLPGWRRTMRWALPGGLILEGLAVLLNESPLIDDFAHREFFSTSIHHVAVPLLAAGYVAATVVWFESGRGPRILAPFAHVGRMALTNYLTQGSVIAFVLFGVGPGLALAGRIGTCALTAIVVLVFAGQVLFSRWWLRRWQYGPAEWVWRALTYGKRPPTNAR
jgi:uncharacterized protein